MESSSPRPCSGIRASEELVQAVNLRDIPMVQSLSIIIAAVYILTNIIADIAVVLCDSETSDPVRMIESAASTREPSRYREALRVLRSRPSGVRVSGDRGGGRSGRPLLRSIRPGVNSRRSVRESVTGRIRWASISTAGMC